MRQAEADLLRIQYLSRDEIIHEAQDLYRHWGDLTAEEKRQLVEAIVARITIAKDEVIIELCYLPPPTSPLENVVTRAHNRIPVLPFYKHTLTAPRPLPRGCPREVRTLGDRLRRRRLERGLRQEDVAKALDISIATLGQWESNRAKPLQRSLPAIRRFLDEERSGDSISTNDCPPQPR